MNQVKVSSGTSKPLVLSDRWKHAEREGILVDRMGHGDISSWSSGTTAAKRPEVSGPVRHQFTPIRSLRALQGYEDARRELAKARTHKQEEIKLPHVTKYDPDEANAKKAKAMIAIVGKFEKFYAQGVVKKAKARAFEIARSVLDDCPCTSPEYLEKLKLNHNPRA